MPRPRAETKKSLYEQAEVEIDGKRLKIKAINRDVLQRLQELDGELIKGNLTAVYEQVDLLVGRRDFIHKKSVMEIPDIVKKIIRQVTNPTRDEKNSPEPGGEKSQQ